MNHFVQSLNEFSLLDILKVFLEHLVQVKDQRLGRPIVYIDNFLESHLDCHVNLRVLLHSLILDRTYPLSQIDDLNDKFVIFDFFFNQFIAFIYNEFGDLFPQKFERCWSALEHVVEKSKFVELVVTDHVDEPTLLHGQEGQGMGVANILIQEGGYQLTFGTTVEIVGDTIVFRQQSLMSFLEIGGARAISNQLLAFELVVVDGLL